MAQKTQLAYLISQYHRKCLIKYTLFNVWKQKLTYSKFHVFFLNIDIFKNTPLCVFSSLSRRLFSRHVV